MSENLPDLSRRVADVRRLVLAHPELAALAAELDYLRVALEASSFVEVEAPVSAAAAGGSVSYFLEYGI